MARQRLPMVAPVRTPRTCRLLTPMTDAGSLSGMDAWDCIGILAEAGDIFGKLALAVVLAGILGLERQRKGRGAGLRTHILVCLGATLAMMIPDLVASRGGGSGWLDTGRMAAGIITGIGFLGAGTIVSAGREPHGLTTAAMVWFVAALGIAIGSDLYLAAVCATTLALVVVLGLGYIERLLPSYQRISVTIRMPKGLERLKEVEDAIREKGFHVTASRVKMTQAGEHVDMTFELMASARVGIPDLAAAFEDRFASAEKITFER